MASLVSQMRNGTPTQQQFPIQQQQSQQQLNESIERTRQLMHAIQGAPNPEAALAQMLQNDPRTGAIANMLKNSGNLEALAKQIAIVKGYDINEVIKGLQGGM